ncbi:non-specific lipid-transfer protein 1-like isoform X2 [Impatiens glandulifera]|uniref:non-specific lipid-transfer protein 1-like isoform X2 n=1 Tax=Impatiens glandulifera TaxID=253017 RepID=UPI001FB09023|nr:non-specific lipid-transfer protein 1-like isoform X2 [Impatiens glandulifera]
MASSGSMKKMNVACAVLMMIMMMSNIAPQAHAVACPAVFSYLRPCITYLTGGGAGAVPTNCCTGVRSLNDAAKTTPDRQTACVCLKSLSGSLPAQSVAAAAGIPGKCRVPVPYKIDPRTDCSKVV